MILTVKRICFAVTLLSFPFFNACTNSSDSGSTTTAKDVTVIPSLGLMSNTEVELFQANGLYFNPRVGSYTALSGQVNATIPNSHTGPLFVKVTPAADSFYYDESSRDFKSNSTGAIPTLFALVPEYQEQIAVTPLTSLAAQLLDELKAGDEFTADEITAMNKAVATAFGLGDFDITVPPTLVRSETDVLSLGNTHAEIYAAILTALADLGASYDMPMVAVYNDMLNDLLSTNDSGVVEGKLDANGGGITIYTYNDIRTDFTESLDIVKQRFSPQFSFNVGLINPDVRSIYLGLISGITPDDDEEEAPINKTRNANQCYKAGLYADGNIADLTYNIDGISTRYQVTASTDNATGDVTLLGTLTETVDGTDTLFDYEAEYLISNSNETVEFLSSEQSAASVNREKEVNVSKFGSADNHAEGRVTEFNLEPDESFTREYTTGTVETNGSEVTSSSVRSIVTATYVGDQEITVGGITQRACRFEYAEQARSNTSTSNLSYIEWYSADHGVLLKRSSDFTQIQQVELQSGALGGETIWQ